MAPFDLTTLLGSTGSTLVLLLIGFSFGFILEKAGFGDSRKLAGQFYFTDLAVIRVMFTAIITAMFLLAWTDRLGMLDFHEIWVNPTYLVPGILGGLIMGFGFIIGGYCPGTSLVAAVTLKIDAILFVLGALVGMLIFGETAQSILPITEMTNMGRLTLQDVFGLGTGGVGILVALLAIGMFWGATALKRMVTGDPDPISPFRLGGAVILVGGMALLAILPPLEESTLWNRHGTEWQAQLDEREVQIDPRELANLMTDDLLQLRMLDLRSEADFHLFHLKDAERWSLDRLPEFVSSKPSEKAVIILMSNDEATSTAAWKTLKLARLDNLYLLEGGLNHWLDFYAHDALKRETSETQVPDETLLWHFDDALGARHLESNSPRGHHGTDHGDFEKKVKIVRKSKKAGGCG